MTRLSYLQRSFAIAISMTALWTIAAIPAYAQFTYQELHAFTADVANPVSTVVDGGDGYIYGVSGGGKWNAGVVYRVQKATNTVTMIHHFNPYSGGAAY